MLDSSLTEDVEATVERLDNCLHKIEHLIVRGTLLLLVEIVHAFLHKDANVFRYESANKHDPLIDQVLLSLELNLNSLEHFNTLNDILKSVLRELDSSSLMQEEQVLHESLNFNS